MSGFANPLVGGGGGLVYPAIKSPDYVAGVSGWAIFKNGTAEFNSVTIRGLIEAASLLLEGSSGEILVYSASPALGDLIGSWSAETGSDSEGNSWPAGLQITNGSGSGVHLDPASGQLVILGTGLTTAGFLQSINGASNAASPYTFLSGASNNDGVAQVFCFGESEDGSSPAHVLIAGFSLSGNNQIAVPVYLVGPLEWSAANSFVNDTNLYRASAGVLKTDDSLTVGEVLTATGGTAAAPTVVTTDTWHTLAAGNGWSGTVSYMMTPHKTVRLSFSLTGPASSVNGVTIVTLPAGPPSYRPAGTHRFPVGASLVNTGNAPLMTITSAGTMQSTGVGASATNVCAELEIPLDI